MQAPYCRALEHLLIVIPAKAGIQLPCTHHVMAGPLVPGL
jgi:hypothetical protein